jgi:N-acetylmuramoyl-L-alanine amidase/putative methionine-R-sulfoxide reductase with GAF domain
MAWLDRHTRDNEGNSPTIVTQPTPTEPTVEVGGQADATLPAWQRERSASAPVQNSIPKSASHQTRKWRPSGRDALQALLAFSALHQQVRQRRALAGAFHGFETIHCASEFEAGEQFVLDEVLQLVAERAVAITGADGLGIALAENNEIVLRASAGAIRPDVGQRIERDSAFSGACFRTAQIIRCDDTETDDRVNRYACRQLGARSVVAVPLCGRRRVIGLLEVFSVDPFGFNDSDVSSLGLLAELIVGALKPEDEERFAESARVAETELAPPPSTTQAPPPVKQPSSLRVGAVVVVPAAPVEDAVEAESAEDALAVVAPLVVEPLVVEPARWPVPETELRSEPEHTPEHTPGHTPEHTPQHIEDPISPTAVRAGHRPGFVLDLVLVVVCVLLAGGLWWKLKNAQLGTVLVQPEQEITKAVTKPAPSAATSSSSVDSSPVNSAADNSSNSTLDAPTSAAPESGSPSAPSQEPSKLARITGIRHWSSADSSTVVLDLEDQVQYEAHRMASPDRIYFDVHDTSVAPEIEGRAIDIGDALLARVRVSQPVSGMTRVVLETKDKPSFSVSLEPNPYRLVVQVRRPGTEPKAQVNLFPGAANAERAIVVPPPTREDLQLRGRMPKMRIVVDAGHGGWDLGTVGRQGLLEKNVVLEIAQRLGKLLESRLGADVILTRNDDNYIPLDERAGMANQSQADLFISVHANYSDLPSARGVETYYTNFFSAPDAKDFETRDPDRSKNPTAAVLSSAELHDKIEQSRRLAASVQRSLYGTLSAQNPGLRDRGVKEASYVVLTETSMPGILAEVSFVSSPTDEQKLRSDEYREQIAEALYKGIAHYAANSRSVKVASATK